MANFKKIDYEVASEGLKCLYDEILDKLNVETLPNWVTYLGVNIQVLKGLWNMVSYSLIPLFKGHFHHY